MEGINKLNNHWLALFYVEYEKQTNKGDEYGILHKIISNESANPANFTIETQILSYPLYMVMFAHFFIFLHIHI